VKRISQNLLGILKLRKKIDTEVMNGINGRNEICKKGRMIHGKENI